MVPVTVSLILSGKLKSALISFPNCVSDGVLSSFSNCCVDFVIS